MAYTEKRGKGEFPWRVRFKRPDGTWDQAAGFAEEDEALEYGLDQESDIRRGRWFDPRKGATPLADWVKIWLAAQPHSLTTAAKRRRFLRIHILPTFGDTPIGEINRFAVRTWASRLTCAEISRQHAVSLLSTILTAADDADMLPNGNPLFRMKLSKAGQQRIQKVSQPEDVWALPEAAIPIAARMVRANALMVLTAAFTGLRYGELAGLHWENCCLLRRDTLDGRPWIRHVIRIDPLVGALHETTQLDKEGVERTILYLGPPKPPNGAREVDVPEFLAEFLAAFVADLKRQRKRERERRLRRRQEDTENPADGIVFTTPTGTLWRRSNWSKIMRPACDGRAASVRRQGSAGYPAWEPLVPALHLHGLRHGHKTAMEEDGIVTVLQDEVMGHEQENERKPIGKRYTHATAKMRKDRLDALTARWEAAGGVRLDFAA